VNRALLLKCSASGSYPAPLWITPPGDNSPTLAGREPGGPAAFAASAAPRAVGDAGVDEVILNCAGVLFTEGREAAFRDAREIIAAVRRRHGG
jgi:hypothetical protein